MAVADGGESWCCKVCVCVHFLKQIKEFIQGWWLNILEYLTFEKFRQGCRKQRRQGKLANLHKYGNLYTHTHTYIIFHSKPLLH